MMDKVLQRQMFSAPQPMNADGVGITSGLTEIAQRVDNLEQQIDNADDYAGVMDALRGDKKSIKERRSELAGYVGKNDANKTPESVLTLVQPTLSIIDMAEKSMPAGGINMQAPRQEEAMSRMAMGEQPAKFQFGGEVLGRSLPGDPVDSAPSAGRVTQMDMLKQLLDDVPQPKTMGQLLPQYQALYGDAGKAYELNPYIAGLQLAGAVANAPKGQLLQNLLAPETIKAVSDPILEMAKAKGQSDLLAKKAAMEAATASSAAYSKAKQGILTAAVPKLMERQNLIKEKIGDDLIIVDPAALQAATAAGETYTPLRITGEPNDEYVTTSLGDGQYATTNKRTGDVTTGGEGTTKWIKVETKEGDVILYDSKNPDNHRTVYTNNVGTIVGDAKNGFVRLLKGKAELINIEGYEYQGNTTELLKNAQRFGELRQLASTRQLTAGETGELEALAQALTPGFKPTEFQTLMEESVSNYENSLNGSGLDPAQIKAKVNLFRQNIIDQYIEAKLTKPGANFDPKAARNKAASNSIITSLDSHKEIASKAMGIAAKAKIVTATTEAFEGGRLGAAKLAIAQYAKELGITDSLRGVLSEFGLAEDQDINEFLGGDIALGEVQKSLGRAIVVDLAGAFPGNLNQTEIEILEDAAVGIGKSPEANKLLAAALEQIADRQTQMSQRLSAFASENRNMDDFELKLAMDQKQIEIAKELDDPEKNPKLKKLLEMYEGSGLKGADIPEPKEVPYSVASTYTTTAAIEADYDKLQDDYPNTFPDLPPPDPSNNNREVALQRVLAYLQGIQQ